jgi:inosine-uridine nucleoside N-ribohydrolase
MDPRIRVISDNDYSGDPDGLFQLAHLLLSPSVDIRGVIGSHLRPEDFLDASEATATHATAEARRIVELTGRSGSVNVVEGSNHALEDERTPIRSAGAELIVAEAMRESDSPLFVTLGGGLTELASAYRLEPRIAERLTAIWIGGPEYPGHADPPPDLGDQGGSEYNLRIDVSAARIVFDSEIRLWQVPRNVYRQVLIGMAEIRAGIGPCGPLGKHLVSKLDWVIELAGDQGMNLGETFILGDNPLVLLTALQSSFHADPSSSRYVPMAAPGIDRDGSYVQRARGRVIRVYTDIDTRLILGDLLAKVRDLAADVP